MKQTAVEWLVQWLKNNPISYGNSYDKAIEQAKAMEKEQIIEARATAPLLSFSFDHQDYIEEAEAYYNETFK